MSKFTQEEEVELVKYCRDLTATIECEEKELSSISKERFVDKPNPPVKKIAPLAEMVKPQYPKKPRAQYMYKEYLLYLIKNKLWLSGVMALYLILLIVSFVNIGFWLTVFGWSWIPVLVLLVLTIVFWQRKRRHLDAELAKKPEYLQAVATAENVAMQLNNEAEARVRAIQKAYDEEFDNQMNEYNNVIIPKYNKELEAWTIFHNRKMDVLREEISLNKNTLKETYDTSKLISSTYRE